MNTSQRFEDLIVWQKAHQLVLSIYRYTESFSKQETFGLIAQFRRASISVPANIAEGFKKNSKLDKIRFMNIAQGSLEECRYYLILANDLGYGECSKINTQLDEVGKLLNSYINAIKNSCKE